MLYALGIILFTGLLLAIVIFLVALLRTLVRVRADAREVWEARVPDAREYEGLNEEAFQRAFFRAHGPRGLLHGLAGALGAALISFPALIVLGQIWRVVWRLSGEPSFYREGVLVWQMYLFFGLIVSWTLVAAAVMRRYHRNRPRELRYELARERDRARQGG